MKRHQASPKNTKNSDLPWGLALVVAVFVAYLPVWWAGNVWDDNLMVTENGVIIGPKGLADIWTTKAADICPLTLTTFWIENQLWGVAPLGYHLINVAFHAGSAVLLWRVLLGLGVRAAWLGGALWALHPVQVESVAWISELKNAQSGFFYLLAILFFVREISAPPKKTKQSRAWLAAIVFGALAIASKSSTVILPLVLILCAWWLRSRWSWRAWTPVLALFAAAIFAGVVSIWTQRGQHIPAVYVEPTWPERFVQAGYAVWFYLGKLVFLYPLLTVYPGWSTAPSWIAFLPLAAILIVPILAWRGREMWGRPCLFAFAYFVVALLPVLGFITLNYFVYAPVADRFQYIASMAPLALLGAALGGLKLSSVRQGVAAGLLCLCGAMTAVQATFYENEETLWNHTLRWNPNCWIGFNNLALIIDKKGEHQAALDMYRKSLAINPSYGLAHYNLGYVLWKDGKLDEAAAELQQAEQLSPGDAAPINQLAAINQQQGRLPEAIKEQQKAIAMRPDFAEYHFNLGNSYRDSGHLDDAIAQYREAFRLKPSYGEAHNSLGVIFAQQGKFPEAITEFQEALRIQPGLETAKKNLAQAQVILQQDTKH